MHLLKKGAHLLFATKPVVPVGAEEELHIGAGVDAEEGGGAGVLASSLPLAVHSMVVDIPHICHNHHNRRLCKIFQSSVKKIKMGT